MFRERFYGHPLWTLYKELDAAINEHNINAFNNAFNKLLELFRIIDAAEVKDAPYTAFTFFVFFLLDAAGRMQGMSNTAANVGKLIEVFFRNKKHSKEILLSIFAQHDAVEFLSSFLGELCSESPGVVLPFDGVLQTSIVGLDERDNFKSIGEDVCMFIPLGLHDNLEESLRKFTEPSKMTGNNQFETSDGRKIDVEIFNNFFDTPSLLAFHLQRFTHDLTTDEKKKLEERFEWPLEFDMAPYKVDFKHQYYELLGASLHYGDVYGGHYIAIIKCDDGKWRKFNDAYVHELTEEIALNEINNFGYAVVYREVSRPQ
jgi:ubiquitin C-terminal hydrolase